MKKFKTREELLQDTLDYYWGKPERRCMLKGSTSICSYTPSETSTGCAIGRLVSKATAKKLQETNESMATDKQFNLLPDWLKEMGKHFLLGIQRLHDGESFVKKDETWVKSRLREYIDFTKIKFPEN